MAAAKQRSRAGRKIRDNRLRRCTSFEVAIRIRDADHGAGICNIDELRIRAGRIEGDAERPIEPGSKSRRHRGFAIGSHPTKNLNYTQITFGEKDVAIWRCLKFARIVKSACVEFDTKTIGGLWPYIVRAG